MTNIAQGVHFDLDGDGAAERMSWTAAGADDAFLVLDRNGNGSIDDGTELFGNFTPQPQSDTPNGFIALAVYDRAENGGNEDGVLSSADAIFGALGFWIDWNHDGLSQSNEYRWVEDTPVRAFQLDYWESQRRDRYGNEFRYISTVELETRRSRPHRKLAVDVFFLREN